MSRGFVLRITVAQMPMTLYDAIPEWGLVWAAQNHGGNDEPASRGLRSAPPAGLPR